MLTRRSWLVLVVIAVLVGWAGLWLMIDHPVLAWLPGQARKSALPPLFGACLLGFPLAIGVMGTCELWFELSLARAARHMKRAPLGD